MNSEQALTALKILHPSDAPIVIWRTNHISLYQVIVGYQKHLENQLRKDVQIYDCRLSMIETCHLREFETSTLETPCIIIFDDLNLCSFQVFTLVTKIITDGKIGKYTVNQDYYLICAAYGCGEDKDVVNNFDGYLVNHINHIHVSEKGEKQ